MDKRFVAVLVFAFVVATGASFALYRLIYNQAQLARAAAPTVKVVLASHDLELGTIVGDGDLVLKDWLGEKPAGASSHMQDFIGRGVTTKIYAKEAIVDSRLALKGAGGGLAAMIPPGMRAVAVAVNEVVGVAGFTVPGMRVDVLISGTPPSGTGGQGTQTRTLLQDIEVLSAGHDFKKDAEGKPVAVQVVNLLVAPDEAERLSLASHQTAIQLVLRNPLDRDMTKTKGVALEQLFDGDKPKSVEARALAVRSPPRLNARMGYGEAEQLQRGELKESFVVQHVREVALDFQSGIFAGTNDVIETIGGRPPISLEAFIEKHHKAFE